jgi:hypothetical protein
MILNTHQLHPDTTPIQLAPAPPASQPQAQLNDHDSAGESILCGAEALIAVAAIVACILFPYVHMLPLLAGLGFVLVGLAVWSDSLRNRRCQRSQRHNEPPKQT